MDNLENYFKKNLGSENPKDEGWNVPPDGLWDNVNSQLHPKGPKNRFPWLWGFMGGAILGLIISLLYVANMQKEISFPTKELKANLESPHVTAQPTNENNSSVSLPSSNENIQTENSNSEDPVIPDDHGIGENIKNNNQIIEPGISEQPLTDFNEPEVLTLSGNKTEIKSGMLTASISGSINTSSQEPYNLEGGKEGQENLTNELNKDNINSPNAGQADNYMISYTSGSNSKSEEYNQVVELLYLQGKSVPGIIIGSEIRTNGVQLEKAVNLNTWKQKFMLGFFVAPSKTATSMNSNENGSALRGYGNYQRAYNFGIELGYNLNSNFTLFTGLEYMRTKTWSAVTVMQLYDKSTEYLTINGSLENYIDVTIPSPLGYSVSQIKIVNPNAIIQDEDTLYTENETTQNISKLSIPLGIQYRIPITHRTGWFAEAGLKFNIAFAYSDEYGTEMMHNGHKMQMLSKETIRSEQLNTITWDYYIGTGLDYRLTTATSVNIGIRYFKSLVPVYQVNNNLINTQTKMHGFGLKAGILFKL